MKNEIKISCWVLFKFSAFAMLAVFIFCGKVDHAQAAIMGATDFISVVDPGNGPGTDYTSLAAWETGVQTDLTSTATQVFSGTLTSTIADNATVYLCRGGTYQTHYGTLVHTTSSQILIESITGSATEAANDIWYTNNTCNSANYFTLTNGGGSANAVAKCRTTNGAADTTAVTLDGWTASANNRIKIKTDELEYSSQNGAWDTSKYRLEVASGVAISIIEDAVIINGLQISSADDYGIYINGTGSSVRMDINRNIIKGNSVASKYGIFSNSTGATSAIYLSNNIIYDYSGASSAGIYWNDADWTVRASNNTIVDCSIGINRGNDTAQYLKNNLIKATDAFSGTFTDNDTNNDYNSISENNAGEVAIGSHGKYNQTFAFENESFDDFHLDSSDTAAKKQGANLYYDANLAIQNDIDGNNRIYNAANFDIGADENEAKIYRSVGPSATTAITTGTSNYQTNHLTISGLYATFGLPLPDNVGVGDAIQYDSDNNGTIDAIAFIDKRLSNQKYRIKSASGGVPTAMTVADIDWSLFRAYTSLSSAEAGTENAGIADAMENFDTGNVDLTLNNLQWNFACYTNGTTADTAAVVIDGWTQNYKDHYLRIYTPTRSDEVGISQRHLGTYSTNYYYLAPTSGIPITVSDRFVNIEGLQIFSSDNDGIIYNESVQWGDLEVSQNIIKGNSTTAKRGVNLTAAGNNGSPLSWSKIWNNIIYDFTGTGSAGIYWNDIDWKIVVFNNTIKDCAIGLDRGNDTVHYIKNNLIDATDAFNGTFTDNDTNNDYNSISENNAGEVAIGSHGRYNQTFTYADSANDNFHLGLNDGGALNYGSNWAFDIATWQLGTLPEWTPKIISYFSDIDSYGISDDTNLTRPYGTTWDIGADEVITPIYRSVAPEADGNLAALATGATNHLNISGSTATFDSALSDAIGVGDVLEYDDDNDGDIDANDSLAFISGRNSSTVFTIKTATGGVPTAPSAVDEIHWNINRAYTSLSNAEAGTENLNIDSDLRNFDAGNRDIAANAEQWNFACYANGTTADTTGVSINGWTTSPTNYIKVYTPVYISEVGTSQRHNGKWDTNKYRIDNSSQYTIENFANYIRFDGLQIKDNYQVAATNRALHLRQTGMSVVYASNNIVWGNAANITVYVGINVAYAETTAFIWNNTIYGFSYGSIGTGIAMSGKGYIYNNTAYGNYNGFGGTYLKNNISYNNTDNYIGTPDSSSTNNLSGPSQTDAPGSNSRQAQSVSFVSTTSGSEDFHLALTDAGAKDYGADLSQDPIWQAMMQSQSSALTVSQSRALGGTDIDGASRPLSGSGLSYDIGADEVATPIYRSNGPSATSYLDRGVDESGTDLTISGSTATIENATPDNVGVGDVIQYDSDNNDSIDAVAFIKSRSSSTSYIVQSVVGGNPIPTTAADQNWEIYRAYASLANAEKGEENSGLSDTVENFDDWTVGGTKDADDVGRDIWTSNEQWNIANYANGTTADTAQVEVNGWTTGAVNYLKLYTPEAVTEVGVSQRHNGKWDDAKYRFQNNDWNGALRISDSSSYVRVEGLQITTTNNNFWAGTIYSSSSNGENYFSSNILKAGSYGGGCGIKISGSSMSAKIGNNIIYGFTFDTGGAGAGIGSVSTTGTIYVYNNTVYNSKIGISGAYSNIIVAKNNLSYNNTTDYSGNFDSSSTNNLSKDATAPALNTYYRNATVKFTDEAGKDFHLDPTDIAARNLGADLSADIYLPITTDIDGKTRPNQGAFDIGADEAARGVYYSVGQNVTDHKSGSPTITISSGLATFSVAQTASNLGVGDKVTYNTTSVAYLLRKVSTTQWHLVTATGTLPADVGTAQTVNSIAHAYASLSLAEAGAPTPLGTSDLAANDYQLYFPCYYDSGADTAEVNISGWTTGFNNFIKIYTPVDTNIEANQRQRHWGKWDDGKYKLEITSSIASTRIMQTSAGIKHLRVDGLQFHITSNNSSISAVYMGAGSSDSSDNMLYFSNNIIWGTTGSNLPSYGLSTGANDSDTRSILYNNIVYGFAACIEHRGVAYSNTAYNCTTGFVSNGYSLRNNIAQSCTDGFSNASGDYNISDLVSDAPSPSYRTNLVTDVAFLDETNKDFHLALTDTMARNVGANLSADSSLSFTTDIDGNSRSLWDIGADEGSVEMEATVMQSGGEYSSLSTWETGMQTDLMSAGTFVFAGTRTSTIADNASLYLCRSGTYQNITGTTVHSMASQILVESISNPAYVLAANDVWYTNNTCNSANYFTISTAGGDPAIAVAKIDGAWTAADTSAVTISGWTTGPQNYVKAYTTAAARHPGKWDETKYRLEKINYDQYLLLIDNYVSYVKIDGLQLKIQTSYAGGSNRVILHRPSLSGIFEASNLIIDGTNSSATYGIQLIGSSKIWNNIIFGCSSYGLVGDGGTSYFYNNTIYGNGGGIWKWSGVVVAKNNLAYNNTDNYSGTFDGTSTNNLSGPSADAQIPATGKRDGVTVSFVNANTGDFHLASDDTGAKNYGADLAADTNLAITNDIDGSTRPTGSSVVDIGADEAATEIYYSVGQNTDDHKTGTPNVTITSGLATFDVPQTATNLGVGDKIIAGGNTYYLSYKSNTSNWGVITALGATPANLGSTAVTSISHAYASLSLAEAGATDSSHLNATNLVTTNYQLNFPCYYDSGPDQTALIIDGYTTGHHNYIKIYTPNNTSAEVNQTQRHGGKWDDSKYRLEKTLTGSEDLINVRDGFVRLAGIQMATTSNDGSHVLISVNDTNSTVSDIRIESNILKAAVTSPGAVGGIAFSNDDTTDMNYVWNNIFYGFSNGSEGAGITARGTSFIYNNTIHNAYEGIKEYTTLNTILKNNIVKGSGNTNAYIGTFSNSDYNATDGTDVSDGGSHSRISQTFSFVDETNKDFHLALADTGAKGYGANLSSDSYLSYSDDIDGQERTGNWTIGADEPIETTVQSSDQKVQSLTDGLVLYQSFDGEHLDWTNTSAEARDQSGSENHGDVSGATSAIGKRGQALEFNGTSDIVNIANSINDFTQPNSACAWLSTNDISVNQKAISVREDSQNYFSMGISSAGKLEITYKANSTFYGKETTGAIFQNNKWSHICYTSTGSATPKFYADGVELSGFAASYTVVYLDGLIGAGSNSSYVPANFWNGFIDEVRVYNRALSADEIGSLYRLGGIETNMSLTDKNTNGLVGMWSFDGPDIAGTTAYDRSPVGTNHGTISGATPAIGKKGQALSFNGTSDYVNIADNNIFSFTNGSNDLPFSVSFWERRTSTQQKGFFGKYLDESPFNGEWSCSVLVDNTYYFQLIDDGPQVRIRITSSLTGALNQWNHVVYTYDGSGDEPGLDVYVNGVKDTSPTRNEQNDYVKMTNYSAPLNIGAILRESGLYYEYFNGKLDEVRIYNKALSADEVGDLYRLGQVEIRR